MLTGRAGPSKVTRPRIYAQGVCRNPLRPLAEALGLDYHGPGAR
jgi:hypothetical protein